MAKVTVKINDKNFIRQQIPIIVNLAERQIEAIARETEKVIQAFITGSIKRDGSTGNLANSFTTVRIIGGFGVGDIDFLNKQAPQWHWVNYGVAQSGRRIPPKSRGSFSGKPPSPGGGKSRWNQSSNGQFLINPRKAIGAMNYIQKTLNEVDKIISSVVRTIKL